jgi:hypothetical protein
MVEMPSLFVVQRRAPLTRPARGGSSTSAQPERSRGGAFRLDPPSPLTPLPGGARGTCIRGSRQLPPPTSPQGASQTGRVELRAEARLFSVPVAPAGRGVRGEGASSRPIESGPNAFSGLE